MRHGHGSGHGMPVDIAHTAREQPLAAHASAEVLDGRHRPGRKPGVLCCGLVHMPRHTDAMQCSALFESNADPHVCKSYFGAHIK